MHVRIPIKPSTRLTLALVVVLIAMAATRFAAQMPPGARTFEVATVKPNVDPKVFRWSFQPGGQLTTVGVPLQVLIQRAFALQPFQIAELPAWARAERFDITAKGPEQTPPGTGPILEMLRTLLAERFALRTHEEMRDQPIYLLVRDRAAGRLGPKLLPPTEDCGDFIPGTTGAAASRCGITIDRNSVYTFRGRTLTKLAADLQMMVGRVITDRTGIADRFDVELQFAREGASDAPAPTADTVTIFTAVREQLGLRLEASRGAVSTLVIDHVERPTPD